MIKSVYTQSVTCRLDYASCMFCDSQGSTPHDRQETSTAVTINLTTADLAARWGMHPGSLANARLKPDRPHPAYFRTPGGRVLYPVTCVEEFEASQWVPARQVAA